MKRTPLRRRTPLRKRNARRLRRLRAVQFGGAASVVRAQSCCVCERWQQKQSSRTQAHHEPPRSCGGTSRDLVPLCRDHHRQRHQLGEREFWSRWSMDWRRVIDRMRAMVLEAEQPDAMPVSPLLGMVAWR